MKTWKFKKLRFFGYWEGDLPIMFMRNKNCSCLGTIFLFRSAFSMRCFFCLFLLLFLLRSFSCGIGFGGHLLAYPLPNYFFIPLCQNLFIIPL